MAKKQQGPVVETEDSEFVEDLYATVDDREVEYANPAEEDLPPGVTNAADESDEEEEAPAAKPEKVTQKPDDDADIPAELRGKSPAELARMYRELHSAYGRQGREVGELRKNYDSFIKGELERRKAEAARPKPEAEDKELDDADFLVTPREAIDRYIKNHPALKELKGAQLEFAAREIQRQRGEAARAFQEGHPDAKEIWEDPEFRAWVNRSPVRQDMIVRAHQNYDLVAANEIFSSWKELKAARTATTPAVEEKKPGRRVVTDKKTGRVPSGGNPSPRQSTDAKGGKLYRRADIVQLMQDDPDRYQAMAPELDKAYAEGRVR